MITVVKKDLSCVTLKKACLVVLAAVLGYITRTFAALSIEEAFARLSMHDTHNTEVYLRFSSATHDEKIAFITTYWDHLSPYVHPSKIESRHHDDDFYVENNTISGQMVREGQSALGISGPITSFLSLKREVGEKSRIFLYHKDRLIASTAVQGSIGDFDGLYVLANQFGIPWGSRGSMRFWSPECLGKKIETLGTGVLTATAYCDAIMTAAVVERPLDPTDRFRSSMLYVGSPYGFDDSNLRAYGAPHSCTPLRYTRTSPDARATLEPAFINLRGIATALYMPTTESVYVGNHEGWIMLYNLRRYDAQGKFLHGRWNNPLLELRVSERSITHIAGDDEGDDCLWAEDHSTLALWHRGYQKIIHLTHKYLPQHDVKSGLVTNNCFITALDRHPFFPIYVISLSTGHVLLYDVKAEIFYPMHKGFLAGFDSDGYLIVLQRKENQVEVKRYSFINFNDYSLQQLALLAKVVQKGFALESIKGPWRDLLDTLPKNEKKRLVKASSPESKRKKST